MADENNDGIAYLAALKRSAGAAAPAPAQEENPRAGAADHTSPSYKGVEKRRSPRYQCEGSVQMREASCDVQTWATFTDISLHGCYVEAQATYPVNTILQLKLEARGMRVEGKGSVRVSYPYLGMGIAFIEMNEENQSRLRELVTSLSRPSIIMAAAGTATTPARVPLDIPPVANAEAVMQAVLEFFRDRQLLMRDDFARIVRQSQSPSQKD